MFSFFFQAEDGIRATSVTGVQTCALPISRTLALCLTWTLLAFFSVYSSALGMFELQKDSLKLDHTRAAVVEQWQTAENERSEERRVGKECRSREARDE